FGRLGLAAQQEIEAERDGSATESKTVDTKWIHDLNGRDKANFSTQQHKPESRIAEEARWLPMGNVRERRFTQEEKGTENSPCSSMPFGVLAFTRRRLGCSGCRCPLPSPRPHLPRRPGRRLLGCRWRSSRRAGGSSPERCSGSRHRAGR